MKNLRIDIDRLRKGKNARLRDAYKNQKHLLEMVKDLKEALDVDRLKIVEKVNEMDSVTCIGFYCKVNNCLEHDTAEEDRMKGGWTGGKYRKKGKPAAPERSLGTNRTPGSYYSGRGQK